VAGRSLGIIMESSGPGFVVVYRWRLHPGKEHSFVEAWDLSGVDP
jgi:hypothetical protein